MPDRLVFDTAGVPPAEAFASYREFYSVGADILQIGPDVCARVEAWRLDRMLLYNRQRLDLGHRRDAQRAQEDGFNHFTATLLLAGELKANGDDGASFLPRPGEVLLADTGVPGTNRMRHAHIVTLSIARDRMSVLPATSMACMG